MNHIESALRDFLAARPPDVAIALVGGIAVSTRTEPRFTRDVDFAVAVTDDSEAERYVFQLRQLGYTMASALEKTSQHRLSTVRMQRRGRGPLVDLLFAAAGIEREVVADAEPIELVADLVANVAQVGHLIAMKLVSRDDHRRPQDRGDLVALATVATAREWARAEQAIHLIESRGYARDRDLRAALAELQAAAR